MQEFVTALTRLLEEMKDIKASLQTLLKLTRIRLLREEWIDGQEICEAFRISARTLQSLRESGLLPYSQLGERKFYYRYSDLRKILKSNYFKNHSIKKHDH